jgi:hypothetical protein
MPSRCSPALTEEYPCAIVDGVHAVQDQLVRRLVLVGTTDRQSLATVPCELHGGLTDECPPASLPNPQGRMNHGKLRDSAA